ncbi:DUF7103 family protein [Flavobacterium psychrophilum]|uniref:DUF7103 family protein n=1 Tax=Flavobacterium psychrophilum TaxID=96345 RepID=UPI001069856A|nr:hypothetical protein [Flavobacterium psychrophilum]GEJ41271.1 hypothetical protein FPN185_contig00011-0006 [Flavobacterium psychrophilum]
MENEKDIKRLEVTLAVFLAFIALINRLIEGVWLPSISAYVDSKVVVGLLGFELGIAGTLFIYNGIGYKRHWYNVILGLSLWGVAIFHYETYSKIHNACAGTFFLGSIIAIGLSSDILFRGYKYLIAGIAFLAILLNIVWVLLFHKMLYSILIMETIGIIPFTNFFIVKNYTHKIKYIIKLIRK